ncbi:MAG: formyl transferase [Porticoccaceae bacterium]|nr:formyl transferase [Porticoccaceae bacterium]|tara:strand:- start:261 stop:1028 length:768 start_codon:yes stop_codon:yes gene_type:complete
MRITLLVNRDLPSHLALSQLVRELGGHELSIFISEKVGSDYRLPSPLMALQSFELELLKDGRASFEQLAKTAEGSLQGFVDIDNKVNSRAGIERIKDSQPDLIISLRFGLIIGQDIIDIPRYGVINLHSGVLPNYRGVMATLRSMLNGNADIGSTLHFIQDSGIDTGDIISVVTAPLERQSSYLFNVLSLYGGGVKQIINAVRSLSDSTALQSYPQQGISGYFTFPTMAELNRFSGQGHKLFDPQERAKINRLYT